MMRHVDIPRSQWMASDIVAVRKIFSYLGAHPKDAREWRGTVWLLFSETNVDEPLLLLEVQRFILNLYREFPHTLYYLTSAPEAGSVLQIIVALSPAAGIANTNAGISVSYDALVYSEICRLLTEAAAFATSVGDDWIASIDDHSKQFGGRQLLRAIKEQLQL